MKSQIKKYVKSFLCLVLCAGMVGTGSTAVFAAKYEKEAALVEKLEKQDQNILISPLSLNMALAMTANGASGKTKKEIAAYLGDSIASYNIYVKKNYKSSVEELQVANSIWVAKDADYELNKTFSTKLKKFYQAKGFEVKFGKPATAKKINNWVKKNTGGMIPKLLDSTSPQTEAILANALYFDAQWMNKFSHDATAKDTFTNSNGKEVKTDFMNGKGSDYFSNDLAEGFSRYYQNSRFEFIAILPKEGVELDLEQIGLESFLASRTSDYIVTVSMPKFEFDFSADNLKTALQDMGIKQAFSANAKLDKITSTGKQLKIDDVIQKAKIIVEEDGTKAAAATGMVVVGSALDQRERKNIKLDRPFAFLIYDNQADSILFIGKVNQLK